MTGNNPIPKYTLLTFNLYILEILFLL